MWPRRIFQDGMDRGNFRRRPVNPRLVEANRLFQTGNYLQAAEIYEELGNKALELGIPQSPRLFIQAGISLTKVNQSKRALELIEKGLSLLIDRQKWGRLKQVSDSVIQRLGNSGLKSEAQNLKKWLDETIPIGITELPIWRESGIYNLNQKTLPGYCPHCGGPVKLEDLEWSGSIVKCEYCGNLLSDE